MPEKAHTNKHYAKVVWMKNENIITKIARGKLGIKKKGKEEGWLYGLFHSFLWVWKPTL